MSNKFLAAIIVIGSLVTIPVHTCAAEPPIPHQGIELSHGTLNLLRAEMREIAGGIQGIALSLATADWRAIEETSAKIQASYIMAQKLTVDQKKELKTALPERFKQLDAEFHQRAGKLGAAAAARDPELAAFHYSRMVESCISCHSSFASERFPGFAPPAPQGHHH